jgi:hypothetical protein
MLDHAQAGLFLILGFGEQVKIVDVFSDSKFIYERIFGTAVSANQ